MYSAFDQRDCGVCCLFCAQIGHGDGLPEDLRDNYEDDEEFLKKAHHILMEVS